ncbi:MAG: shikimate kinase AroL [Desulfohalobiaceae bacterium]
MSARFIKKKQQVEEADRTGTYRQSRSEPARFDMGSSNLFFIGPRCCGKTTIAREVAQSLGGRFVDTDQLVVDRIGMSISDYVAAHDWEAFRDVEEQVLEAVCSRTGQVVATGGGAVLRPESCRRMQRAGEVFYLLADVPTLRDRIERDPNQAQRPSLSGGDIVDELARTVVEREPLYMSCANHVLHAHKPVQELVGDVLVALGMMPLSDDGMLDDF